MRPVVVFKQNVEAAQKERRLTVSRVVTSRVFVSTKSIPPRFL